MEIPGPEIHTGKSESWYRGRCNHNSKELAFLIGVLYRNLHDGRLPDNLEEIYFDKEVREALGGAPKNDENFCPLPSAGKLKMYTYHKPPPNASDDFVVLECPNHPDNKWTLLNIGASLRK